MGTHACCRDQRFPVPAAEGIAQQPPGAPRDNPEHPRPVAPRHLVQLVADRLLTLADEARAAMHEEEPRGVLRLGAMESTAAVRLPAPLSEFHRRHPEVSVELHIGHPQAMMARVAAGGLDAALVAEPLSDPRLESRVIYEEELVIVADAGHAAIRTPRDVSNRTVLAFHPGCPHRKRLEEWFARGNVMPERFIEMGSYHAILGCAVVGMGIALMPRSVLDGYAEQARLSVHPLAGKFRSVRTLLVWRGDSPQAKVAALAEVLLPAARRKAPRKQTRNLS